MDSRRVASFGAGAGAPIFHVLPSEVGEAGNQSRRSGREGESVSDAPTARQRLRRNAERRGEAARDRAGPTPVEGDVDEEQRDQRYGYPEVEIAPFVACHPPK